MTERIIDQEADGCEVVRKFDGLFAGREERVRKIVKDARKQAGLECQWSHWFCLTYL